MLRSVGYLRARRLGRHRDLRLYVEIFTGSFAGCGQLQVRLFGDLKVERVWAKHLRATDGTSYKPQVNLRMIALYFDRYCPFRSSTYELIDGR